MKLAFEKGHKREIDDPVIQTLTVEYEPKNIKDAFEYVRSKKSVRYYSADFDFKVAPVLAIDFGSYTEFCYLWDLTAEDKKEFFAPSKDEPQGTDEEIAKRRFAYDILSKLKSRRSISYEEAVAISKILKIGGE